ncbi:MAG: MBL fold metallo-hydrolase [Burkholderiaceae bacterium]|nr:MBL fold metallo-hydrolase [Burkholderiaceae bacterium]
MTFTNQFHQHAQAKLLTPHLRDFGNGIYGIDSGYFRDEFDAVHLIVENGRVAIIDTSTNYTVPRILESIGALGLGPECVDWILLSHVHLDHAGGAGLLAQQCPNAKVTVHPRGRRHMVDPSKLFIAVCEVYGEEMARREYGTLVPIAEDRIVETGEGAQVSLAGRVIEFWDSPGHAKHHVYIRDLRTNSFFTGDTFGISYRDFDTANGAYCFVTTSPSQFTPEDFKHSVSRLMAAQPQYVYLTHYAQLGDVARHGQVLLEQADEFVGIALRHKNAGSARAEKIRQDLQAAMMRDLRAHGVTLTDAQCLEVLDLDLKLNSEGLVCWLDSLV